MTNIEERAYQKALKMMRVNPMARPTTRELLVEMAIEQRKIDIENCVKWCKKFNEDGERIGCSQKIDVDSFREWIKDIIEVEDED